MYLTRYVLMYLPKLPVRLGGTPNAAAATQHRHSSRRVVIAKAALIVGTCALLALQLRGGGGGGGPTSTTRAVFLDPTTNPTTTATITTTASAAQVETQSAIDNAPPLDKINNAINAYRYTDPPQLTTDEAMKRNVIVPPLRASGRYILDRHGERVKLASINWYGASDEHSIAGGLDTRHRSEIAATIRRLGFNSVRLPYSDEMVMTNPLIPSKHLAANPDLHGHRALDVYEAVVTALADAGIATIVNNHNTQSTWFTGMTLCDATWRNDYLGSLCRVRQTEQQWIEHWESVMARFVDQPLVIGADLRNEVHGFYGTVSWEGWATACERAGERLLRLQPDWLMFVEGISSANDVSGARDRPVQYSVPGRVVYSAHVYSWSGWGSMSPFGKRKYPSFREEMQSNWAYLLEGDIAPVWVGEFGVDVSAGKKGRHYWDNLMRYLAEVDADFGYWALNPRKPHDNEYESYSILGDDWKSEIRDDFRMQDMRRLMKP